MPSQTWDVWVPGVASRGLSLARGRLEAASVILIHAAGPVIDADVLDDDGRLIARGRGLERTAEVPMARLTQRDGSVSRLDLWPEAEDIGRPVLLPGGEVGILTAWWNADDGSEWRWSVEFYNHR